VLDLTEQPPTLPASARRIGYVVTKRRPGLYLVGTAEFPEAFSVETLSAALSLVNHLIDQQWDLVARGFPAATMAEGHQ